MIDGERLRDLEQIMGNDFADLVEIFIEDSQQRLGTLKQLLQQKPFDFDSIKNDAHTLKGSSANLFATNLQQLYFSLEKQAANGSLNNVNQLVSEIEKESDQVIRELHFFREK